MWYEYVLYSLLALLVLLILIILPYKAFIFLKTALNGLQRSLKNPLIPFETNLETLIATAPKEK